MKWTNLLYTEWLKVRRYWAFWGILFLVLIAYPGITYLFYSGYQDIRSTNRQLEVLLKFAIGFNRHFLREENRTRKNNTEEGKERFIHGLFLGKRMPPKLVTSFHSQGESEKIKFQPLAMGLVEF